MNWKFAALAACTGVLIAATPVYAQAPTALEQAELAGLSPEMRTQVQSRAVGGNSITEVLQVMLLNNIKAKHPASQIVAMDWARGVAVVEQSGGGWRPSNSTPRRSKSKVRLLGIARAWPRCGHARRIVVIAASGGWALV